MLDVRWWWDLMPEICCCCCSVLFSSNVLRHLNPEFHIYLKFCAYFLWCLVLYPPQIEFARRCILFAHIMQFIPPFYSFDISDQLSRDQQCRNEVMDHWNYKNQDSFNVLHFLTSFRCVFCFFLIKLVKLPYPALSNSCCHMWWKSCHMTRNFCSIALVLTELEKWPKWNKCLNPSDGNLDDDDPLLRSRRSSTSLL